MYRRPLIALIAIATFMGVVALGMAAHLGKPLSDPDGFLGPAVVRLPLLAFGAMLADLLPRTLWVSRFRPAAMPQVLKDRWREHWTKQRVLLVVVGVLSFYITYVCYRNIKSNLPLLLGERKFDRELHLVDRALFFGHEPGTVIHAIVGTGWQAHFLSSIYLAYLPFVAISVAVWLVWSRNIRIGYWFAIATCLTWGIGTFAYYALPTLGPGFSYSYLYADLPTTGASDLMDSLFYGRENLLRKGVEDAMQSIGGFASLHTAITLLWALMAQYTVRTRWVHWVLWTNFVLTVIATLYFGWHYVADDLGGATITLFSFYVGGLLAGFTFDRRRTDKPVAIPANQWPSDDLHDPLAEKYLRERAESAAPRG